MGNAAMYGLLLRAIQSYLRETFGALVWARILRLADQPPEGFEPMLPYDAQVLRRLITVAARELDRPLDPILEDVGTFIVSAPSHRPLRRLLRFGGASFSDFLHSLEELPDRARLALPGLELPQISLAECVAGQFRLEVATPLPALLPIALGALRAMADDYGALVVIDIEARPSGRGKAALRVQLLEAAHSSGQHFALSQQEAANGG
ncbi:heme NO-binding domain-containing protein [Xinfangfangia sp. CPCC 101601]|uniref:Heme NO-binding domain-containing protein n=1 Tax=Pseudogemmobacter lacusdianii TaxID=3069608 RepID=A0ABU0VVB2_9RHOB|nr:heme NO-binding domain-containing protein [Xinfangfangia sp. CPCC 101601]MDQ2065674.1 heme NO-binding domain-containing protein [Xinfangfangia sp. CPCC 101601]